MTVIAMRFPKKSVSVVHTTKLMHHLIAKDKVPEQHILQKHSKCNTFRVISSFLRVAKMVIAM